MEHHGDVSSSTAPVPTGADGFPPWLTVGEAVVYCQMHGLSRTQKTVRKWAQLAHQAGGHGDVAVRHQDTENGFRWLIDRGSLDLKIAQEIEYEARRADAAPTDRAAEPVATGVDMLLPVPTGARDETLEDSASEHVDPGAHMFEPVHTNEPLAPRGDHSGEMIGFLKDQIDEKDRQLRTKDEQIAAMLERDRETNVLIRGLQNILALRAPSDQHDHRTKGDNSSIHDA